ncbi:MAG TPA: hypothetical protein ENK04_04815 [Gammaproteobacteria bacterium]|nr:hypothetical protein [Gammaproteobacteria bacterium]
MIKYYLCFIFVISLTSCTTENKNHERQIISDIEILTQGNISREESYFQDLCGDFRLTKEQVKIYYHESRLSNEQEVHDRFNLFPCYSTGTIRINGEKYMWKIRAGGVSNFYNENEMFLRVCDEKCCKRTKGIC